METTPLNSLYSTILGYWQRWTAREKLLIVLAAAGLLVSVFYNLYWRPVNNAIDRLTIALPTARSQLAQMRIQAKQVPTQPSSSVQKSLLPTVEQSLDNHGLRERLTQLEPSVDNSAQVILAQVNYVSLIKWLVNLERQFGIVVQSARLRATDSPGIVNARIVLQSHS